MTEHHETHPVCVTAFLERERHVLPIFAPPPPLFSRVVNFRLPCWSFTATRWELLAINPILYNHTFLILS